MSLVIILSAVMAAQSATAAPNPDGINETRDAAYEQLAAGDNERAIAQLEQSLASTPGDPALLINLGTAYTREGRLEDARKAFEAAVASDERYQVELADGSWEDSHQVARLALASLGQAMRAQK